MANAANRRQIEAASRREKGIRKAELDGVRYLMEAPVGRALAYRLLEQSGAEKPLPFQSNAMNLARDVGVQSFGFALLEEIREACPELELVMRREAAVLANRIDEQEELEHANEPD